MSKVYLTDRLVRTLEAEEGGRAEAWDTVVPGLGLRYSGRKKSWFFVFHSPELRDEAGRRLRRRLTLGDYPRMSLAEARAEAARCREAIQRGADPTVERAATAKKKLLFRDLAEQYLELESKPKRVRWDNDVPVLRALCRAFGHREAGAITAGEILEYLEEAAKRGPWVPRDHRKALSRVLQWGVLRHGLPGNPVLGIPNPRPAPRDRVFTVAEVAELWRVCEERPFSHVTLVLRLRLLTAQRGLQLRRMNTSQFERDGSGLWWNVPARITKTSRANRIFLSPLAEEVLATVPPHPDGWVFQGPPPARTRLTGDKSTWRKVRDDLGSVEDWRGMDLRRTAATWMAQRGVPRFIVKRVLGHADHEITAVYDLYSYDREVRAALLILEQAIREAIGRPALAPAVPELPAATGWLPSAVFFPQFPGVPR